MRFSHYGIGSFWLARLMCWAWGHLPFPWPFEQYSTTYNHCVSCRAIFILETAEEKWEREVREAIEVRTSNESDNHSRGDQGQSDNA